MYSYIARQPILDIDQEVVAYELLFRDGESNSFPNIDPDQATSNILTNNHLTLGLEKVTGDLPAYINFHTDSLIRHFPSFLDPQNVVIEILEDVEISDELVASVKKLKEKGYRLALDDHDFDSKWAVLFPYIDIIKVDILAVSMLEISRFTRELANSEITLLAEKVETAQEFEKLKMLGFTLFQGYFFAKPEMLKQKKLTTTKQNILDLISQALDYLSDNPLPATILVTPTKRASKTHAAQELLTKLENEREVNQGKLDLEWLTRLEAITTLVEDIVIGIAVLLCMSVVLIIGNTIRLAILNQRDAIAVMKLVGATDSFIQRPFLYAGVWYGILGGIVATVGVGILAQYFTDSLLELTNLYQSDFSLTGLSFSEMLILISFAVLLGLTGSFISVRKHIRAIEPTAD